MREPPTRRARICGSSTVRPPRCRSPMRRSTSWFPSRRSSIWPGPDQPRMVAEIARVLSADGVLVLSAPNPVEYTQATGYRNPFHLHEPEREELDALLAPLFPFRHWYGQRRYFGSAIWNERREPTLEAWSGDTAGVDAALPPAPLYFVVVAARNAAQPIAAGSGVSLFSDRNDAELLRMDREAAEVIRLDRLLGERDAALDRQAAHVRHLEDIAVVERDAHRAALTGALQRARRSGAGARVRATGCRHALARRSNVSSARSPHRNGSSRTGRAPAGGWRCRGCASSCGGRGCTNERGG